MGAMIFGVLCLAALASGQKYLAIITLLCSGLLDATDGTLARGLNQSSDMGCMLDIFSDRFVEASIVLGLYLYDPTTRGWPALLLMASFYLCITTFLLSGIFSNNHSDKGFHYSPGLIERGETFIFFLFVIIWDQSFSWAALFFAILVIFTAVKRFFELLRASFMI